MKKLNSAFAAHIGSGASSLVNCWRITRVDGVVLGFTDHDKELTFDNCVFLPSFGMDRGEVASKLGAQVDTSEIVGIVNSNAIDENDILLGRYDDAIVETFKVNWKDVENYQLMRRDSVGEITRTDGVFKLELRSSQHGLNINKGRVYQTFCDCVLGDSDCSIDIEQEIYKQIVVVVSILGKQKITVSPLSGFANDWFSFGYGVWNSGQRAGKKDEIVLHKNESSQSIIGFGESIDEWVQVGDEITLYAGCDRAFSTCREKFSNVVNFRGFPHIPGSDFVLRYPKAGADFSGKPLYK